VVRAFVLLLAACARAEDPRVVARLDAEDVAALTAHAPDAKTTDAPAEVLAGQRSVKGDSRAGGGEWHEYLHTKAGLFAAREAYTVTLTYRVLTLAPGASAYCLFRRAGDKSKTAGWQDLTARPGERGSLTTRLWTGKQADWTLVLGIRRQAAVVVDDIVVMTDPANRQRETTLPAPQRTWTSPGKRTWHIDAAAGDDAADGQTPASAWRTLARVNSGTFAPGDAILLKAGCRWAGFLAPGGRGTAEHPIRIDRYGDGAKPALDAEGQWLATLYLLNVEHCQVRNLDIANRGAQREAHRTGVTVRLQDFGVAHDIVLADLDIHDVNGSLVKADGGGAGISITRGDSDKATRSLYDGLLVEGCRLTRCDRNGLTMGGYWTRGDWHPNRRVILRGNRLEDIGGDGLVPAGCDGALVEHNVLRGGRMRCQDHAAGIWPWSCDNTIVQHNEVSGVKGTRDGQGFDSDWNCRGTLIQYNYSHDNEGGFLLICNDGSSKMPWNIGNQGTVVRYNISRNDGARVFHVSGPCRDTLIHNNTIVLAKGYDTPLLAPGNWGGAWPENTRFVNNLFAVAGRSRVELGGMKQTTFAHNLCWGEIAGLPDGPGNLRLDPQFTDAGAAGDGFASLLGLQLRPGSPALGAGLVIKDNGGRDFWGRPVSATEAPNVGA
jgi:hypothetical protein